MVSTTVTMETLSHMDHTNVRPQTFPKHGRRYQTWYPLQLPHPTQQTTRPTKQTTLHQLSNGLPSTSTQWNPS